MNSNSAKFQYASCLIALLLVGCGNPKPAKGPAPEPKPVVKAPAPPPKPVFRRPEHVRGIYLTAWSAGSSRKMAKVAELMKGTDLNSVVIDVRDAGVIYVKNDLELATTAKATQRAIRDLPKVVADLREQGIYAIARIACFRDDFVPKSSKTLGIRTPKGGPWKDRGGHTWLDPYNKTNWEYVGKVVDIALDAGFPEIQLDYVRFPSEGKAGDMVFLAKPKEAGSPSPAMVIKQFGEFMAKKVKGREAVISADIFGIISSGSGDQGIGQELEQVAAPFDLICPMVYPSHFAMGEYGIANPNKSPYLIVHKSLRDHVRRMPDKPVRPWLQDFSLGVKYGKTEVREQIKACLELGIKEFLFWNAKNEYTRDAYIKIDSIKLSPPPEPKAETKTEPPSEKKSTPN